MDLFVAGIDLSESAPPDIESTFAASIRAFSAERTVSSWQGARHFFHLDRIDGHFLQNETLDGRDYFLGRDAKAGGAKGRGLIPRETSFPFLALSFDENRRSLKIESDSLGLFSYFYAVRGSRAVISNYFPAVAAFVEGRLRLDPQSYTDLLLFGTTSPGKTVYRDIGMGHPLETLEISAQGTTRTRKPAFKSVSEATPADIYDGFKRSVRTILNTSSIQWLNITGGSDTRLILSTLDKSERESFTFIFDEINSNPTHIPHDRAVLKMLKAGLGLNIQYRFPRYVRGDARGFYDGPKAFTPYSHLITGMYGGETLGGNAIFCLPDPQVIEGPARHELIDAAISDREKLKADFREHFGTQSDLGLAVTLFGNSFMSFIYGDVNWTHPYILLQKKISPYINTEILTKLFTMDFERIRNYRLYADVYRAGAPEMMKYPYFSRMTAFNYPGFESLPEREENLFRPREADESLRVPRFELGADREELAFLETLEPVKSRLALARRGLSFSMGHER